MLTDSESICVWGAGDESAHVTKVTARRDGDAIVVDAEVTGPKHTWSTSSDLALERWTAFVSTIEDAQKQHRSGGVPMFDGAGRVAVELHGLQFEAEGGTTELARSVADIVLELVSELGGPDAAELKPERGLAEAFGNADDTIDEGSLRSNLHDTIPDALYRGPDPTDDSD